MTTPEPIQYQTDQGTIWTLTHHEQGGTIQYLIEADGMAPQTYDRVPLPVHTDLPWANPESLLFSLTPENQGLFGVNQAIERIKNKRSLYSCRRVSIEELQLVHPEAFESGVNTINALFELFCDDDYYVFVTKVIDFQHTANAVLGYRFNLFATGSLDELISLDDWTQLYQVIQDAPISSTLSCELGEWQWLHQKEGQALYQMVHTVFDSPYSDWPALDPSEKEKFLPFSSDTLNRILFSLLSGCPIDVILDNLD